MRLYWHPLVNLQEAALFGDFKLKCDGEDNWIHGPRGSGLVLPSDSIKGKPSLESRTTRTWTIGSRIVSVSTEAYIAQFFFDSVLHKTLAEILKTEHSYLAASEQVPDFHVYRTKPTGTQLPIVLTYATCLPKEQEFYLPSRLILATFPHEDPDATNAVDELRDAVGSLFMR